MCEIFLWHFWRKWGFWQHLRNRCSHAISMGELLPVCSDLSQFLSEHLYFTESIFLNRILVWPLNANGNWAKFFPSGKFSGNLVGNSPKCVVWEILHTFRGNGGKWWNMMFWWIFDKLCELLGLIQKCLN